MMEYKENNLLLVDGSALLNIIFYASISDVNKAVRANNADLDTLNGIISGYFRKGHGHYTENVGSFIRYVLELSKDLHCSSLVVLFDKNSSTTFRKKRYPAYKENRDPKPDAIRDETLVLHCILNKIGIKCYWSDIYEADDLAGSLIERFKGDFDTVYFYTRDHDWFQLLDENVKGIVPQTSVKEAVSYREYFASFADENNAFTDGARAKGRNICISAPMCRDLYGIYPEQVADFKGLSGDKSDNIPGIRGVGTETAKRLLELFGTMDDLYQVLESMDEETFKSKVRTMVKRIPYMALKDGKKEAEMSRWLATIKTDIPIYFSSEALRIRFNMENIVMAIRLYNLESDLDRCFS